MTHYHDGRLHAPPTDRNRDPILAVLRRWLPATGTVLEIASGTGQHALYFTGQLPGITWQPTDIGEGQLRSIAAWRATEERPNLLAPLPLDVTSDDWPVDRADAILNVNMIHASPWTTCLGLFRGAARVLPPGAPVLLYGPFMIDGEHTAPSNARFSLDLQSRHPNWGVRDLADVRRVANENGFELAERVPVPSNNFVVVFTRQP